MHARLSVAVRTAPSAVLVTPTAPWTAARARAAATATAVTPLRRRTRPAPRAAAACCVSQSRSSRQFSSQKPLKQSSEPPSSEPPSSSSSPSHPASVADFLAWAPAAPVADVFVRGYVRSVRAMKRHVFVALGDGSSLAPLQAVVPAGLAAGLANGAAVRLQGAWTPSPGAGQTHELRVQAVDVLGPSDAQTFPVQKKYHTPEYLRSLPHLRARVPFQAALLRLRSDAVAALGRFFAARAFVQTHPPLITSSDCEGAGEVFSVVAGASSTAAPAGETSTETTPFFRTPKYLTVSTQLHLEALAQAVGPVWTLSPTFRAEQSDTPRHLSEFYMLEAEVGFVDRLDDLMDLAEDMVRAVAADLHGTRVYEELLVRRAGGRSSSSSAADDLEDATTVEARWQGLLPTTPATRWPRITYTEAIRLLAAAPVAFDHAPVWGASLQTEHEKYLAQAVGGGGDGGCTPVFVTHYPRASKAFYMLPTGEEGGGGGGGGGDDTVDCFDLLVPDFCEIAGGSLREHRLPQLLAAMQARGLSVPAATATTTTEDGSDTPSTGGDLDWYVDLRRWGCPPHGGFGLGFDRLLCYLSGVRTIRDTVAFPRWYGRCDC